MLFNNNLFTEDDLLSILKAAKDSLIAGKSIVSWTSLGSSATLQWDIHPLTLIKECTLSLQKLDPTKYGRPVKTGIILHTD